jgi:hypothetical protein
LTNKDETMILLEHIKEETGESIDTDRINKFDKHYISHKKRSN